MIVYMKEPEEETPRELLQPWDVQYYHTGIERSAARRSESYWEETITCVVILVLIAVRFW